MAFRFFNMAYYSWKTSPSPSLSPSPSPSLLALAAAGRFRAAKVSVATNDPLSVEKKLGAEKKVLCFRPARQVQEQVTHSMEPEKMVEMFKTLEEWAEKELLGFLKPVEKSWQPQDLLPDPSSEEFFVQVKELRQRAEEIPDEYFVCLVGNMITEEALPTYQTFLNTLDGVGDETCASLSSWSIWTRAWTAEENRHGDLLKQYLYLSGRVHMKQVEKTIQYLIGSGMYVKTENSPYRGYVYTSFQERATFISHGNTARQAKQHGDLKLARILGTIAADEKRHEAAYVRIVEKLFEVDPDGAVIAFADMMKRKIVMPGHLMYDGRDQALFDHLGAVTHRLGVYTAADYADILDFLVWRWKVENLTDGCLSDQGKMARDYVCGLASRVRRLYQIARERRTTRSPSPLRHHPFSWIFDRELQL